MNQADLEPLLALVSEIEQARLGARWRADANGDALPHEPTAGELLDALLSLYWQGRNAYDAIAAKVDGAQPYGHLMGEVRRKPEKSKTDPKGPF